MGNSLENLNMITGSQSFILLRLGKYHYVQIECRTTEDRKNLVKNFEALTFQTPELVLCNPFLIMEPICQNPHEIQERLSWSPGAPAGEGCECAQDSASPQPCPLWGHDCSQLSLGLVRMFFVDRVCGCQDELTLWIHGLHGWVQHCSLSN